jgi:hypothetical protein
MFDLKPDFEDVMKRWDAWWECQIIDRPIVTIAYPKPAAEHRPLPKKTHASIRDRWLDGEYQAEMHDVCLGNMVHYADALPIAWPNLGPEVFSAYYGCPMIYSEGTAWSEPIQKSWRPDEVDALRLDTDGFFFQKTLEMTDAFLERAKGRFIVGMTDLHPGGDCIAAFRDPQLLCFDMLEHIDAVKQLCDRVTKDFIRIFDIFYERLAGADMPGASWLPTVSRGKYHIPSNDFSCMISDDMFYDVFLPGIIEECRHMDRTIYHLDGPDALRFLDTLLAVPEIHAIQWVAGSNYDYWGDWIEVYQRIQAAGKAFVMSPPIDELDKVFEALRPEGVWLNLGWVNDEETARGVVEKVKRWKG